MSKSQRKRRPTPASPDSFSTRKPYWVRFVLPSSLVLGAAIGIAVVMSIANPGCQGPSEPSEPGAATNASAAADHLVDFSPPEPTIELTVTGTIMTGREIVLLGGAQAGTVDWTITQCQREIPDDAQQPNSDGQQTRGGRLQDVIVSRSLTRLSVTRGNDTTELVVRDETISTADGALIRFQQMMRQPGAETTAIGHVAGDKLFVTRTHGGQTSQRSYAWTPGVRGPAAVVESLLAAPMKPGQTRTIRAIPELSVFAPAQWKLTAGSVEPVKLLGNQSLHALRIDFVMTTSDGIEMTGRCWADATGNILRSENDATGLATIRVIGDPSKVPALPRADLLTPTFVPVDPPARGPEGENARTAKRLTLRVTMTDAEPAEIFPQGPYQQLKADGPGAALVTLSSPMFPPIEPPPVDPPTPADSQPTAAAQSDDPAIIALANAAVGDQTDPLIIARRLEAAAGNAITTKGYAQAMLSASDVVKLREGDCTEHTTLLVALLRAKGIPARAALGLLVIGDGESMGFHMWTEAYIDGRWVPLDAIQPAGLTGADHLKVGVDSLRAESALGPLVRVLQLLGRTKAATVQFVPGKKES